jgi:hypothetical protein
MCSKDHHRLRKVISRVGSLCIEELEEGFLISKFIYIVLITSDVTECAFLGPQSLSQLSYSPFLTVYKAHHLVCPGVLEVFFD